MKLYGQTLPDELVRQQWWRNAQMTEQFNIIRRGKLRERERILEREFRAHGWRERVEVIEGHGLFGEPLRWEVFYRRPRGLRGWLRHKVWWWRVWWACRREQR